MFKKGPEFRDWLLTKLLNAEFNCHKAPDFLKLAVSIYMYMYMYMFRYKSLTFVHMNTTQRIEWSLIIIRYPKGMKKYPD